MNGFIKFFRILLSLDCMHDTSILAITVYLLANARFMPTSINGFPIESGQLVVDVAELSDEYKLTEKNVKYIFNVLSEINAIRSEKIGKHKYIITLLPLLLTGTGISHELIYSKENTSIDYNTSPLFRAYSRKKPVQFKKGEEKEGESPLVNEEVSVDLYDKDCLPFGADSGVTDNSFISDDPQVKEVCINENILKEEGLHINDETDDEEYINIYAIPEKGGVGEKKNTEKAAASETEPYGKFRNVILSKDEYEELRNTIPSYKNYIELFSAYLAANSKDYDNHFAAIYSWYLRDNERGRVKPAVTVKTPVNPLYPNGTSYDLERAEKRALESVPKLKKREKR